MSLGGSWPRGHMGSLENLPVGSSSGGGLGFRSNREAFAVSKNAAFNTFGFSNLMDGAALRAGSIPPRPVPTQSGGAVFSPGAGGGNGYVGFNAMAPAAGVAAIDQALIAFPPAESWMVGARVRFPTYTNFTGGLFCIPLGIVGTGAVYLQGVAGSKDLAINFFDTSDHFFSAGAVATLGTVTLPVGIYCWVSLEFNVSTGVVTPYFSDVAGTTRSGADLAHFANTPSAPIFVYSSDNAMGVQLSHIFLATVAPL